MTRRVRNSRTDELARWGVVLVVIGVTIYGAASYSTGEARQVVDWPAIDTFFRRDFANAGFGIRCDFGDPQPSCTVEWKPPFDPRARALPVYVCDDQRGRRREEVLLDFAHQTRARLDERTRADALSVLNAFFESGLRQNIDGALRRARDHANFANRLPPFELEQDRRDPRKWTVVGVDDTLQAIPTGLPNRPPYTGSVYASWDGTRANLIQVTARSSRGQAEALLTPGSAVPCPAIHPGSAKAGNCGSVDVLLCRACREPAVNIRAVAPGLAVVTSASDRNGNLLARTLEPLTGGDLLALDASRSGRSTTLYVDGVGNLPDLLIDVTHDTSPPLSRLRLVNGRWKRWFEPAVERWLSPVVQGMNRYAREKRVEGAKTITLTVDIDLQRKLDEGLDAWMRVHAEPALRTHQALHFGRRTLARRGREQGHHRPAPEAGVTVIDAATGHIVAVASYPPSSALVDDDGFPAFAPGWQARLAANAPPWARREIVSALADRLEEDANSNFVRHPIGSTIKPLLLSLVMDDRGDGLSRLFNLVTAGHVDERGLATGGGGPPECPACAIDRTQESIAGFPLGPWGSEEAKGAHAGDPWIDRREFLLSSCNKYAVTLGVLTLLDWSATDRHQALCCWLPPRDQFGFAGATGGGAPPELIASLDRFPAVGPWLDPNTAETVGNFANAPLFQRLEHYYGVHAGSRKQSYDSDPWIACAGLPGLATTTKASEFLGRVETTDLALTSNRVSTTFTNLFTGGGRNWWTNVKLAEAYARLATNRRIEATFCAPAAAAQPAALFTDAGRWQELVGILAEQRMAASWVRERARHINEWAAAQPGRVTLSKTGTSLREAGFSSTGIFVMYAGEAVPGGRGYVIVGHVDDIGHSGDAVQLVNDLFPILEERLP